MRLTNDRPSADAMAPDLSDDETPKEPVEDSPPVAFATSPGFRDIAPQAGLDFRMGFLPGEQGEAFKINLYDHGCGLAVADYDSDGREDIYFLNQLGRNALYRNLGDGRFVDVAELLGVGLGDRICVAAAFADYDSDGDSDLFVVSTRGGNVLFRNDEGAGFTDVTEKAGLAHVGHSQSAAFFDYDRDGRLDLLVLQTAEWTSSVYDEQQGYYLGKTAVFESAKERNILYRNLGDGRFADVTEAAGLAGRGWSADAAVFDYDQDGWQDLLVACMFGPSQLYRNQRDGSFRDVTAEVLGATPCGGVGVKLADVDSDGRLDLYIVDMHSDMWMGLDGAHEFKGTALSAEKKRFEYFYGPRVRGSDQFELLEMEFREKLGFAHDEVLFGNACYRALGDGRFEEASQRLNLENLWPWGVAPGDFDNDADEDLLVTAGMGYPFWYWHNYLMMNAGENGFQERSLELGVEPPRGGIYLEEKIGGRRCAKSSRSAATADFDNDGRLEVVTNNFNDRPYFFQNEFPERNYITLELRGVDSNRDAVGAVATVVAGGRTQVRQVQCAGGYLSQSSNRLHFGLGDAKEVERIEIAWPNGRRQTLEPVATNRLHRIVEDGQPL